MPQGHVRVIGHAVLLLVLDCVAEASVPPLAELLDRYTEALDSTASMISYYETRSVSSAYLPPLGMNYRNETVYERGQRRTDGQESRYHQACNWGYVVGKGRNVPESEARYSLLVTTPAFVYSHGKTSRGRGSPGGLLYQPGPTVGWGKFRDESDAFFLGYLGNDSRIDKNLREARSISVRAAPQQINGSVCYVIEADTAYGDYTIWLDAAHGYQPARIEASREKGDIVNITALQPTPDQTVEARDKVVIDNIAFKEVQGVWVPVIGRARKHVEWPKYRFYTKDEIHFKITEILLHPDHEALESFEDPMTNPNLDPELINGTRVRLGGRRAGLVWRDGRVVDQAGKVVDLQAVSHHAEQEPK